MTYKNFIKFVLHYPVQVIFSACKFLGIKIFVGRLYTSRIGHLCFNAENWIAHTECLGARTLTLFITDKTIANTELIKILKSKKSLRFLSHRWCFLYSIIAKNPKSEYLVDWNIAHREPNLVSKQSKRFNIPVATVDLFQKLKARYSTASHHVCFHNRDNAYLEKSKLIDGNFHDYRNFHFSSFKAACQSISELGLCAVRVGKVVEVSHHNFSYLDLSGNNHSDDLDIGAIGTAEFLVTGNTGLSQIARLFRRPVLALNYAPFRVSEFFALSENSLLIPKKVYDKKSSKLLNLLEIMKLADMFNIHYSGDFFSDNNYHLIENTETEIQESVMEMHSRLKNSEIEAEQDSFIDSKLLTVYAVYPELKRLANELNIRISTAFLTRNPYLLCFN
jgi:putative glycosyltransferase (TIGR04372 family)